jgi:hypothetical protein
MNEDWIGTERELGEVTCFFMWYVQPFICPCLSYSSQRGDRIINKFDDKILSLKKSYPCKRPRRHIALWDVEAPTFSLDNRLTHGGKFISLTSRPPFTPKKIPSTHFRERLSRPQGHSAAGRIRSVEKSTSSGLEPATVRLVAYCLNQLRYRVPPVLSLNTYSLDWPVFTNVRLYLWYRPTHISYLSLKKRTWPSDTFH